MDRWCCEWELSCTDESHTVMYTVLYCNSAVIHTPHTHTHTHTHTRVYAKVWVYSQTIPQRSCINLPNRKLPPCVPLCVFTISSSLIVTTFITLQRHAAIAPKPHSTSSVPSLCLSAPPTSVRLRMTAVRPSIFPFILCNVQHTDQGRVEDAAGANKEQIQGRKNARPWTDNAEQRQKFCTECLRKFWNTI